MWAMRDDDGLDVAANFYRDMLEGDNEERHKRAAHTLWKVTRAMRKKKVSLERWVNFVHIGA